MKTEQPTRSNWEAVKLGFRLAGVKTWHVVLTASLYALAALSVVVAPYWLRLLMDATLTHDVPGAWRAVWSLAITMGLGWLCLRGGFRSLIVYQVGHRRSSNEASFERATNRSHAYYLDEFAGRIVKRAGRVGTSFEAIADVFMRDTATFFMSFLGSVVLIATTQPQTGLLLTLVYLVSIYGLIRGNQWKSVLDQERAVAESALAAALADTVANQQTVRLFHGYAHELERYREKSNTQAEKLLASWLASDRIWGVQTFMTTVIAILAVVLSVSSWARGRSTAGDIVLTYSYVHLMAGQVNTVRQLTRQVFEALVELKESLELVEDAPETADPPNAKPLQAPEGSIEFRNVSFSYRKKAKDGEISELLRAFDLLIPGGKKIALCGRSGGGKTTIFNLLMHLFPVDRGQILIDDQPIECVTEESLRRVIALVPQEPVLFHRSLMDNIRYGRRNATDAEVIEAAKQANCHEFIMALEEGYNTKVGERGVKLSGGQKQRVAMARAFVSGARILLLDEATAQLDSENEAEIHQALTRLMQDRTVLVIAHRLSTLKNMDEIIVIDKGKIVDRGTHRELVKRPGLYAKLWNLQAGEYQAAPPSTTSSMLS